MKRLFGFGLIAALLVTGLSCGDSTGPSGPGQLKVRLTSANSGLDSAIVFTITGPAALTSATAGTGLRVFRHLDAICARGATHKRHYDPHDRGAGHPGADSVQRHDSGRGDPELSTAGAAGWLCARADPLIAGVHRRLWALPQAAEVFVQTPSQVLI